MKRASRVGRGTSTLLFPALVLASACSIGASTPVTLEVAPRCPDFSGHYFFPGIDNAVEVCPILNDDVQPRFRWPTTSGGFGEWKSKAIVAIRQDGCSALEFRLLVPGVVPGVLTSTFDLKQRRKQQEIDWTLDSLTYRDRAKPAPSFTISPVNIAKKTVYFRRESSGALTYRGTYWEATEGRKKVMTECTLRRALPEDWRAVGLEEIGQAAGPKRE